MCYPVTLALAVEGRRVRLAHVRVHKDTSIFVGVGGTERLNVLVVKSANVLNYLRFLLEKILNKLTSGDINES